jgi:hypothetical protein
MSWTGLGSRRLWYELDRIRSRRLWYELDRIRKQAVVIRSGL